MALPSLLIPLLIVAANPAADVPAATISPSIAAPAAGTPLPAKLEFPLAGYRMNALESGPKSYATFTMNLPVSGTGHPPPLVNVVSQPTTKEKPSLPDYVKIAKTIHAHFGDTIVLERTPAPTEWQEEYTRDRSGKKEHVYLRVFYAKGSTYEVSATAPDTQWAEFGPKLKACVDSFELSPAPAPGKTAFPQQGYRISLLDGAAPPDASQALSGYSRVFVGIMPYAKTLKDYQADHKPFLQIPNGKFKILTENASVENVLVTEYADESPADKFQPQGSQVLVYEKVVLAHGQLYYATGIHWSYQKDVSAAQIKACVESLEALPTPGPTPAPAK